MTSLFESAETSTARQGWVARLAAWIGRIEAWIALSIVVTVLMRIVHGDPPEATSLWFLDPVLSLLFLALMWSNRRFRFPKNRQRTRKQAAATFLITSWTVGMLTELTLSKGGRGYGGLHEKTVPSFILAEGYYIPLSLLGLWRVRR